MNSFTLTAIGNLAADPELMAKDNLLYTRFCLVANDYGGKDVQGAAREVVTSVWFVAFNSLAETIALNARKGDQLIVTAQLRADNWIDREGEKQYRHAFVAQGFRFGAPGKAKRDELAERQAREPDQEDLELRPTEVAA